jgi:hypothetical protein
MMSSSKGRQPSSQKSPDPSITERWSALGQGLPFASGTVAAPDMRVSLAVLSLEETDTDKCSIRLHLPHQGPPSQHVDFRVTRYIRSLLLHHQHHISVLHQQ